MIYFLLILLLLPLALYLHLLFIESKTLILLRIYLKLNYNTRIEGLENIPKKGPCILVCNHFSYIDWLFIMSAIPRPVHFVIHYRFYYAKIIHPILKKVGAIPISADGERPKLVSKAFAKVSEDINNGNLVLIFPEGGITRDGKVNRFKKGILKIKEACPDAPIIPMSMDGLWGGLYSYSRPGLFSLKKLKFGRTPVTIKIHPPYNKEIQLDDLKQVVLSGLDLKDGKFYKEQITF